MKRFFFLCIIWFVPLGIAKAHHEHAGAAKSAFEGQPTLPIALVIVFGIMVVCVAAFELMRSKKTPVRVNVKKS